RRRDQAHRRHSQRQGAAPEMARWRPAGRPRVGRGPDAVSRRKPALLVTGAGLAREALALLRDFEVVYAGKTPGEGDIVDLCATNDPVAIIVRYGKVAARASGA